MSIKWFIVFFGTNRTMDLQFATTEELLQALGQRIRGLRHYRDMTQAETAAIAGVAVRTVRHLESGAGATTESFLRVLKALQGLEILAAIPVPTVSPIQVLRYQGRVRQRVRPRRKSED